MPIIFCNMWKCCRLQPGNNVCRVKDADISKALFFGSCPAHIGSSLESVSAQSDLNQESSSFGSKDPSIVITQSANNLTEKLTQVAPKTDTRVIQCALYIIKYIGICLGKKRKNHKLKSNGHTVVFPHHVKLRVSVFFITWRPDAASQEIKTESVWVIGHQLFLNIPPCACWTERSGARHQTTPTDHAHLATWPRWWCSCGQCQDFWPGCLGFEARPGS